MIFIDNKSVIEIPANFTGRFQGCEERVVVTYRKVFGNHCKLNVASYIQFLLHPIFLFLNNGICLA